MKNSKPLETVDKMNITLVMKKMTRYSIDPRSQIFGKGYGFLSFPKNIGKNISKHLSGIYSPGILAEHQKLLDNVKQSAMHSVKTATKKKNQKTAEKNSDLIGNKMQIKLQRIHVSQMLKSSLFDYSDTCYCFFKT